MVGDGKIGEGGASGVGVCMRVVGRSGADHVIGWIGKGGSEW